MSQQWFKFYGGEFLSDPKMERLNPLERSCWITLLCLASSSSNEGVVEFLTVETLLNKSGIQFDPYHPEEWEKALSVLPKFTSMRMIEMEKNGDILVKNWDKRQEQFLTGAERAQKYRDNKKSSQNRNNESDDSNARVEKSREEDTDMSASADVGKSFEKFWSSYPKKELKKKTKEIWDRKKLGSKLDEIISFIEKAKNTDRWQKGYIKQPPVFLNGECWNDDISSYGGIKIKSNNHIEPSKGKYDHLK